jgi:hypothetical protein
MDFYELLDDMRKLLHQRGRVTYRAVIRQFHLDDDVLDDVKLEALERSAAYSSICRWGGIDVRQRYPRHTTREHCRRDAAMRSPTRY